MLSVALKLKLFLLFIRAHSRCIVFLIVHMQNCIAKKRCGKFVVSMWIKKHNVKITQKCNATTRLHDQSTIELLMNKYAIECVMITINKTVLGFSCCNYVPCALLLVCLLCSPVNMLVVVVQTKSTFWWEKQKKTYKIVQCTH